MKKLLIILTLLISIKTNARDIYVSTSGSNSNSGSSGSPYLTMSYAASQSVSGDLIHVLAGTFIESSRVNLPAGVSIIGTTGTVIKSTYSVGATSMDDGIIRLNSTSLNTTGQYITGIDFEGGNSSLRCIATTDRSNISIYNCTINNFELCAISINYNGDGSFVSGNYIYSNIINDDCTVAPGGTDIDGSVTFRGVNGLYIHDNSFTQTGRSAGSNGDILRAINNNFSFGMKNVKIYNNTFTKPNTNAANYNFTMEFWFMSDNCEIYGNTFNGTGGMDLCQTELGGGTTYSTSVHDNTCIVTNFAQYPGSNSQQFINYEDGVTGVSGSSFIQYNYCYNNVVVGIPNPIRFDNTVGSSDSQGYIDHNYIYSNVFANFGYNGAGGGDAYTSSGIYINDHSGTLNVDNIHIYNNTISGNAYSTTGIAWRVNTNSATNISCDNNIITGVSGYGLYFTAYSGTVSTTTSSIQNNDIYSNGNNTPTFSSVTMNSKTQANNISANPLFVSSSNYHLQSGSPCINTGINVGLPYSGSAPDIGAYEYGAISTPTASAGSNKTLPYGTISTVLDGTGSTDVGGTITNYLWTQISGGTATTIVSPTSSTTNITGLITGTFIYQLKVTDNNSNTSTANVTIIVNPNGSGLSYGLVSYYKLDEISGTVLDAYGTNNGTAVGGVTQHSTGKINNGYLFDGTSGYVTMGTPIPTSLQLGNTGTLSGWVYLTDNSTDRFIITTGDPETGSYGYSLGVVSGDAWFALANSSPGVSYDFGTLPLNTWIFIAVTWDGSTVACYINGVLKTGYTNTQTITPTYSSSYGFSIGDESSHNDHFWKGNLDEIGIWNVAISYAQVDSLFNGGVGFYPFASTTTPVSNAGTNQTLSYGTTSTTLTGVANDIGGTVVSTKWILISGLPAPTITNPASLSTTVTGLTPGTYIFRLSVTDNNNNVATSQVTIVVNKGNASLVYTTVSTIFNGLPQQIGIQTTPVGLATSTLYNGISQVPTNANTYTTVSNITDLADWNSTAISGTFTITPLAGTFTASNQTFQYDSLLHTITVTTSDPRITYTLSNTSQRYKGIYLYTIHNTNTNFSVPDLTVTMTITAGIAPTPSWSPANMVYGATIGIGQVNATDIKNGTYNYTPTTGFLPSVGSLQLKLDFIPSDTNLAPILGITRTITVTKRTDVITVSDTVQYADGSSKTIHPTDLYGGTLTIIGGVGTIPGNYPYTVSYSDPNNQATTVSGTLHILSNAASIYMTNYTNLPYTGANLFPNVNCPYSYTLAFSPATHIHPGSYQVIATINDGIHTGADTVTMTIIKATPIGTWGAISPVTYLYKVLLGILNASTATTGTWAYNVNVGDTLIPGTYNLLGVFTPTDSIDYNSITLSNSITVNKGTASISITNTAKQYNTQVQYATVTTTPPNLDSLIVTYTGNHKDVGSYPISANLFSNLYTASTVTGTLTISQSNYTLSWATPTAIQQGTALNYALPTSSIAGTFTFNYPNGYVAQSNLTLIATFRPTDTNYPVQSISVFQSVYGNPLKGYYIKHGKTIYLNYPQ